MMLKIHPAIGIARLGNSPDFYVGPEIPGVTAAPADGQYKDASGIRRQAAQFHIFRNDTGGPVEVTAASAGVQRIEWTVQIANRKAAVNEIFSGVTPRNPGIATADLVIAPAAATLTAPGASHLFDDGKFRGRNVSLGEARTDAQGRLLMLASQANSDFVLQGAETGGYLSGNELNFDNNPFWYDTTADGSISATVFFTNGTSEVASQAWVILGPPDFAPGITTIVTLYDAMLDLLLRNFQLDTAIYDSAHVNPDADAVDPHFVSTYKPSFTHDIYPILSRPRLYKWVFKPAIPRHATLVEYDTLCKVSGETGDDPIARKAIFDKLRHPDGSGGTMPKLKPDGVISPGSGLSLTRTQYEMMRRWKNGNFNNDWVGPPAPAAAITPEGLDRAALESCIGASFFPGIETNRIVVLNPGIYELNAAGKAEEIRLKPSTTAAGGRPPGYLTADNALPWQADFLKCARNGGSIGWWPAARPDDVFRGNPATSQTWANIIANHKDMVDRWTDLKFVAVNGAGEHHEQP